MLKNKISLRNLRTSGENAGWPSKTHKRAFTLVEIILVVGILSLLLGGVLAALSNFLNQGQLKTETRYIGQMLRRAQSNSALRHRDSRWGLFFDQTENSVTLFRGSSYASREATADEVRFLPRSLHFKTLALADGGNEIAFLKETGATTQYGNITIENRSNPNDTATLNINSLGQIEIP